MATNVKLLLEQLRYLTIYPEQHNQGVWATAQTQVQEGYGDPPRPSACGSSGCLAGNTVLHQGIGLKWYQYRRETGDGTITVQWGADMTTEIRGSRYRSMENVPISDKARELLGLTECQADALFNGGNSLDSLWRLAEQITGGEIDGEHYREAIVERDKIRAAKA